MSSNEAATSSDVQFCHLGIWWFTRSRQWDVAQKQPTSHTELKTGWERATGKSLGSHVFKTYWEHAGYFFCVWEPEEVESEIEPTFPSEKSKLVVQGNDPDYIRSLTERAKAYQDFFAIRQGSSPPCPHESEIYSADEYSGQITPEHKIYQWVQAMKPRSFQACKIIYHTERHGSQLTIEVNPAGRQLYSVLCHIIGYKDVALGTPEATKVIEICTKVASQVADAVVEMSTWKSQQVQGVDGKYTPDLNFAESLKQVWSQQELERNCDYAGLNHQDTVFSPGSLSPYDIIIDENNDFVGFSNLSNAGFAPRNWVQLTLLTPAAQREAGICVRDSAYHEIHPSILLTWPNVLSDELAARGFEKINPHRIPWRRRRAPSQDKFSWRELDEQMRQEGKSSWKELVPESEWRLGQSQFGM